MKSVIALLSLLVASPALAADVWVTVASDPPGASIFWTSPGVVNQHEIAFGPAPQSIKVHVGDKDGCVYTNAIRVRWVSGIEASLPTVWVCKKGPNPGEPLLFIRPSGVPGLETDARYALDLARLALDQQRVKDGHDATIIGAALAGTAIGQAFAPPPAVYVPPVHCTSSLIGSTVYTNCQ